LMPGTEGPPLVTVTDGDGEDAVQQLPPLGLCEGNCEDRACAQGLVCYERKRYQWVPGCSGKGKPGHYYCADPSAKITTFRLRLYWQDGYDWQDSSREKYYCASCEGSCSPGNDLELGHCDEDDEDNDPDGVWQFINADREGKVQIQMYGTDLCWEMVSDSGDETSSRVVSLARCDTDRSRQWFRSGEGDFDSYRFELKTSSGKCVSSKHHPKKNEDMYETSCSTAEGDDTNFWTKY